MVGCQLAMTAPQRGSVLPRGFASLSWILGRPGQKIAWILLHSEIQSSLIAFNTCFIISKP